MKSPLMKNKFKTYSVWILALCAVTSSFAFRSWYQKAPVGGEARHRCTGFVIGNKGYIGGGHVNSGVLITYKDYWQYDPATNSWSQIADFGGGDRFHSSSFTIGDFAYVGGGEEHSGSYMKDFWKYIPSVNIWERVADFPGIARRGGVGFALNNFGYYGTGQSTAGYLDDFYKYDPESDSWTPVANFIGAPRNAAVAFTDGNKAYVGTGHIPGAAIKDFYAYDPISDQWEAKADVGDTIRQDATAFFIDGKGYVGTGHDELGNDFDDFWEYNIAEDTWTKIADFEGQKRRYAVSFVIDNIAYLCGGTDGTNFKDLWAWAPSVGIQEEDKSAFQIYPNPSYGSIVLESNDNKFIQMQVSVFNLSGEKVHTQAGLSQKVNLELTHLKPGIYFVKIVDSQSKTHTKKLTIIE
jgi:N-acetylneuraminic acid mutarotase